MTTKGSDNNNEKECCCCRVDEYDEMNRTWTQEVNCAAPFQCCNIPTKEECEIQLNPTFDGSCGHMNEPKYQQQHNGPKSQQIYRSGVNGVIKGWLGQRLYDSNLNVIEEWCIDNGRKDSFFLWRFVHCNGDYPNWFARCVFPSATNSLLYKGCNSDDFRRTIPSCFGQLEEMNIGLGDDIGHDVDYRYDVNNETLFIWCTNYTAPKDPLYNIQYEGKAPADDDGIVPFYLEQCRSTYSVNRANNDDNNRLLRDYYTVYGNNNNNNNNDNNNNAGQYKKEMLPLTFRVGIMLNKLNNNFLEIIITGNNMPIGYEAVIQYNDSISFNILNSSNILINSLFLNAANKQDWIYTIHNKYLTFTYINKVKQIILDSKTNVGLAIIQLFNENGTNNNVIKGIRIGWIARSNDKSGSFVGFGKLLL